MNLLIFSTAFALSSAALLPSNNYIPQDHVQGPQSPDIIGGGGGSTGNTRPQQDAEKNSAIVNQEQDISETGNYRFGYETSNGIRVEEAGGPEQAQGGFTYKGDDGHTYTVTYTTGEGGFKAQADHLPVAPPTPEAILLALQQNERDEAAGIFDDGQYHPDAHGGGQYNPGGSGSSSQQTGSSSSSGYQY